MANQGIRTPSASLISYEGGTLARVKRQRKQAWRAYHKTLRSLNSEAQKTYRASQKILEQPSLISVLQFGRFAQKAVDLLETKFQQQQQSLLQLEKVIRGQI
jgi:DNA-binding ferritin-like protein (Dps family)